MLRDLVREVGAKEIAGRLSGSGRAARELARLLPELSAGRAPARHGEGGPNEEPATRAALPPSTAATPTRAG